MATLIKTSNDFDEFPYKRYKNDLNWRDDGNDSADGQGVEDPSMKDFIKGYNLDQYQFQQWATSNNKLMKKAFREVDVIEFNPEYLSDKILKYHDKLRGNLQDFFEGFTMRYSNTLKRQIAQCLSNKGYKVYPIIIQDTPIYAKRNNTLRKIANSKNIKVLCKFIKLSTGELDPKFNENCRINDDCTTNENCEVSDLVDVDKVINYYLSIYPENYAVKLLESLTSGVSNEYVDCYYQRYHDNSISDAALDAMESYLRGDADTEFYNGGVDGYDFTSDMYYDTTAPNTYEVRTSKLKKN